MSLPSCIIQTEAGLTIDPACLADWLQARKLVSDMLPPGFPANNLNEMRAMNRLWKYDRQAFAKQVAARYQNVI